MTEETQATTKLLDGFSKFKNEACAQVSQRLATCLVTKNASNNFDARLAKRTSQAF